MSTGSVYQKPDVIVHNGRIHTVDAHDTIAQAIAVRRGRIWAVGDDSTILALAGDATEVIDAKGRSVIPGVIDSHNHAWEAGRFFAGLITFGISSLDELKKKLRRKVAPLPPGTWLQGGGWIESQFREGRMPTRWDLDEAAPDHPVVLERIFSTCVANSRALALAGITAKTPDPPQGEIDRHPDTGEPTGLLHRAAKMLVRQAMPGPFGSSSFGQAPGAEESIVRALDEYLRWGITSIVEPGVTPALCRAYQNLYAQGKLTLRVNLMPNWHGFAVKQEREHMDRLIEEMGFYTGFGDHWLRLGALKMAIDGGLTSRSAYKSWPYVDEERARSDVPLRLDMDELDGLVEKAHANGWSVGIHVVGDLSQERAVKAIHRAFQMHGGERRHQIIHGYYPTKASLRLMKEANIIAAVQPAFIYGEADGYPWLLSLAKQREFLPLRSYHASGIVVALSTDMPSAHFNPFWGMYAAVTRKGMRGHQLGSEEAVPWPLALRMMTLHGAYLTGEEHDKGSLEVGKLADLALLDRDLVQITPEAIRHLTVLMTMVNGRILYQA